MQFTDNRRVYVDGKKNIRAYTHIRVHASPRDDTALIEFLDPRRSAWLFITRAIYLRVIPLLRRRRHANRKRGQKTLQKTVRDFYPLDKRHWILSIFYVATAITFLYIAVRNFSDTKMIDFDLFLNDAFIRWGAVW